MMHGSLFSGIGGFDLAAEWMGWTNVFHCEWNPFGRQILNHYWPNAKSYEDITQTDFSVHRGHIDILTGGFPCQPYSVAGQRLGKDDERHLWPEMLRAIREIKPRWVVGENVRGIISWSGGLVFEEVQADLEVEGYEVQPFILPAAGVGAPHRRDRVWFVAHTSCTTIGEEIKQSRKISSKKRADIRHKHKTMGGATNAAHANGIERHEGGMHKTEPQKAERHFSPFNSWYGWRGGQNFPTQPPVCGGDDGLPRELDGITFPKWRNESIKAYGNAIVPQVALQIFKAIEQYEMLVND